MQTTLRAAVLGLSVALTIALGGCDGDKKDNKTDGNKPATTQAARTDTPAKTPATTGGNVVNSDKAGINGGTLQVGQSGGNAINFEKAAVGKLPEKFASAMTGAGGAPAWEIKADESGNLVLAQTSTDNTNSRYPICVYQDIKAKDVDVLVKFKAIAGKVDQAAGIVVRYKDAQNYYVVRANALEENVRFYKVEAGKRTQLGGKNGVEVVANKWQDLRLVARGNKFEVSLGGEKLFEAEDKTFEDPGQVGVWTKADSVTYFDDMKIVELK